MMEDERNRLSALALALGGLAALAYGAGMALGYQAGQVTACLASLAGAWMLAVSVFYALDEPPCPWPEGWEETGGPADPASPEPGGELHSGEDVLEEAAEIIERKNKAVRPLEPGGPGLEINETNEI